MNKEINLIIKGIQEDFRKNLIHIVKTEAGPALIDLIMEQFRLQLEGIAPETDPTAPEKWKDEFYNLLVRDLERTLRVEGDTIKFGLGDREELGYGYYLEPTSQDVLKTFVYILEGIIGEYAWITEDIYRIRHPKSKNVFNKGRFGVGFLIPKNQFYAEGWSEVIDWETARWGFSGEGPKHIFQEALRQFKIKPYVEKAIHKTLKELQQKVG